MRSKEFEIAPRIVWSHDPGAAAISREDLIKLYEEEAEREAEKSVRRRKERDQARREP